MLFRYSYAAKVGAKHKSLCYRYVIFRLIQPSKNIQSPFHNVTSEYIHSLFQTIHYPT